MNDKLKDFVLSKTGEYKGYGKCPKCKKDCPGSSRERRWDGCTRCSGCGYYGKSSEWPK